MKRYTLSFAHSGSSEKRDDHWAAYSDMFGITVYGRSREHSEEKLQSALMLLVDTLISKGPDHVEARFRHGGVKYLLTKEDEELPHHRFTQDITHDLTHDLTPA